jgi:hypothetical protein
MGFRKNRESMPPPEPTEESLKNAVTELSNNAFLPLEMAVVSTKDAPALESALEEVEEVAEVETAHAAGDSQSATKPTKKTKSSA